MPSAAAGVGRLLIVSIVLALSAVPLPAQVDAAREEMRNGNYSRAIVILTATKEQNPTADTYLYLGISYANLRDLTHAEETLREGARNFPADARFHHELAGVYLAKRNVQEARKELHEALRIDPDDLYASDLIANIDLDQGQGASAFRFWRARGAPVIVKVLNNNRPLDLSHWAVRRALAFQTEDVLSYRQWRTTERRLLESGVFSNVNLEVQPTPEPARYNANIVTSFRKSTDWSRGGMINEFLVWTFTRFLYLDLWNIRGSGISVNGAYRLSRSRQWAELNVRSPLPLPGGLVAETTGLWRSEKWNISGIANSPSQDFRFSLTDWRFTLRSIPDYRFEAAAGFELIHRRRNEGLPAPLTFWKNSGKFLIETRLRLADGNFKSRIQADAFLARKSIMGGANYSGATLTLKNRVAVGRARNVFIDSTAKGGTTRGLLPIDEYFVLGADAHSENLLRGHPSFDRHAHHYGNSPMGTDFVLSNLTVELRSPIRRRISVYPEAFLDIGKTFDRARIFKQGPLLADAGVGLKIETQVNTTHVLFGHSLNDRSYFFGVIIEKNW